MTDPREDALAKGVALAVAAIDDELRTARDCGAGATVLALNAIKRDIAARAAALSAPSEPTAEGQDELRRQLWNMTQLATERHAERDEARADLARMKAAIETACVCLRVGGRPTAALDILDTALKGTSPC